MSTTLNIHKLFTVVTDAVAKYSLCATYQWGPVPDLNISSRWDYPMWWLDNEIFITRTPQTKTANPFLKYDVGLYLLDVPRPDVSGAGDRRKEVNENIKPRFEKIWAQLWTLLTKRTAIEGVWAEASEGWTLTPIEYDHADGVCGYRVDFALYGHDGQDCDFTALAGALEKFCETNFEPNYGGIA